MNPQLINTVTIHCTINNPPPHTALTAFTDGSKIDNKVGAAATIQLPSGEELKWQSHLHQNNSVHQAETTAILQAINLFTDLPTDTIHIVSDSQSSIQAIKNEDNKSPLAQQIRNTICNSHKNHIISWTKGHSTCDGNNRADELAKQAAQECLGPTISIPWPRSYLKQQLHQQALQHWQQNWNIQEQGRRTHGLFPKIDEDRLETKYYLTQFITGHGPFPTYFKARNLSNTDTCACGTTGDAEHYLFHCTLTSTIHTKHPTEPGTEFTRFLLKHPPVFKQIKRIIDYLHQAGLDLCHP
ncbi:uncharacterized protein LOC118180294 [Stegodyphus dumicola]|uniref:uncharacterized protein LOC118180294 n=1 Tax=Stegodyphus dumicola TaxID=202533 RepID=UPI0015A83D07|nr:uncharacterized protein LOC118180294 [Stegodyphus dumicola]